jgi:acetyl-CoA C-acetyltransferase
VKGVALVSAPTEAKSMAQNVYIIGAGRTDFKRNAKKEGIGLRELILEAGRAAIADARIDPADVESGVVENFAAGLFTRQLHLGAFLTEIDSALRGLPTLHTEAACASGGVAVLNGIQQIMGQIHEVVLIVGVEQQKTMSPADGADVLGAAAEYAREKQRFGAFVFPKLFAEIARVYQERHGLTERQLALVAVKNYAHARSNPQAQMRDAVLSLGNASQESEGNPRIAPPLKVTDCSQITDGAAALVLCSEGFLRELMGRKASGARAAARLVGFGHTTDYLPLERKQIPEFPQARRAARQAYEMAGLQPTDIDAAEIHDCFTISELVGYEVLGLCEPGQAAQLLESGATALPEVRSLISMATPKRSIPVNPGGGLLGDGHPVGATGVRQVAEAYRQLTGTAGPRQVRGARRVLTCNVGGSFTSNVVMIWERP